MSMEASSRARMFRVLALMKVSTVHSGESFLKLTLTSSHSNQWIHTSLDPSVRVTYHPLSRKVSQTGLLSKSVNYVFTQRMTLHNTKSLAIENVKLIDQIPVSENSVIIVKLVSPSLDLPDPNSASAAIASSWVENKAGVKVPPPVKVSQGVVAQWENVEEVNAEDGVETIGRDGKIGWVCALPSQGKVTLTLQWEVSAPLRTDISGL